MKPDEKTLLADLPTLEANVDLTELSKFIKEIPPSGELPSDASIQERWEWSERTRHLLDRNAGMLKIDLSKDGVRYTSLFQDFRNGEVYPDEEKEEPLSDEIRDILIDKGVAVDDVDEAESYFEIFGEELDGFFDDDETMN